MNFFRSLILIVLFAIMGVTARAQSAVADTTTVATDSIVADPVRTDSLRMLPDSTVRSWKRDPHFAYANDPSYWKKEEVRRRSQDDGWFDRMLRSKGAKYFIYLLLGGILLFAIIRIILDNKLLFYRSRTKGRVVDGKDEPGEVLEDVDEGLRQAIQAKDHRQAVRYLYIKTLRRLGDRGLIRYHLQTTNQEYIQQLGGSPMERSFRHLTDIYDRVWYGEFALTEGQFERIYTYFEDFYKTIGGR